MNLKESKSKANHLEPIVRVGKNGLNESTIKEIRKHIIKQHLIKVKFLKAFIEGKNKKEEAKRLAELTNSVLVHQVGFVVVLARR